MNELELRGLKALIKEVIEDDTDINNRLMDAEESIRDLEANQSEEPEYPEEEPEEDLPEEETLEESEPNPERKKYDQTVGKAKTKLSEGARVDKSTMKKLQNAPTKTKKKENAVEDMDEFEEDFNEKGN